MPERIYRYTGYNREGIFVKGTRSASSESEVRQALDEEAIEIESVYTRPWDVNMSFGAGKVKTKDLLIFTRLLAAMHRSGVNTSQALDVLQRQTRHEGLKRTVQDLSTNVRKGTRLSEAVRRHPKVFPGIYAEIVTAGEKTGTLPDMLARLEQGLAQTERVRQKVKSAMIYPSILLLAVTGVAFMMLTWIIPQFEAIFAKGGYELPMPTLIMLGLSDIARTTAPVVVPSFVLFVLLAPRLVKVDRVKKVLDRALLKIPVMGDLVLTGAMANYCRIMAMTLASGVVVVDALRLVRDTMPNHRIAQALREATREVATGSRLAPALERTGVFPPTVVLVTAVGEKSGELASQYAELAEFFEDQVIHEVDRTLKLLEPALILIIFGAVSMLLLAIYTPLFKTISVMGG